MPERDHNSTVGAGLPWAFVLDPAANAAAVNDVQRRGLEAARRLIDSIVAKSDSSTANGPDEPRTRRRDPGEQPQQGEPLAELIRCWTQLTTEVLGKLAEDRGEPASTGTETAPTTAISVDGSEHRGSPMHCLDVDWRGRLFAASEIRLRQSFDPVGRAHCPPRGRPAHTRRQGTRRRQCPVRSVPDRRSPSRLMTAASPSRCRPRPSSRRERTGASSNRRECRISASRCRSSCTPKSRDCYGILQRGGGG